MLLVAAQKAHSPTVCCQCLHALSRGCRLAPWLCRLHAQTVNMCTEALATLQQCSAAWKASPAVEMGVPVPPPRQPRQQRPAWWAKRLLPVACLVFLGAGRLHRCVSAVGGPLPTEPWEPREPRGPPPPFHDTGKEAAAALGSHALPVLALAMAPAAAALLLAGAKLCLLWRGRQEEQQDSQDVLAMLLSACNDYLTTLQQIAAFTGWASEGLQQAPAMQAFSGSSAELISASEDCSRLKSLWRDCRQADSSLRKACAAFQVAADKTLSWAQAG